MGVVLGCFSTIDPIYIIEIAPQGKENFYGAFCQLGIPIGMLIFNILAPTLTYMQLYYVGASIDFLLVIFTIFIDESPVVTKSAFDEKSIIDKIPKESLFQRKYFHRIIFGIFLMLFQQFCGINAILTNIVDLMTSTGIKIDGNYQAGITTSSQIISICCSAIIIEKIGLKITWIISCLIVVISLLVFALNVKFNLSNILSLITIFFFQLGFGLGIGPIPCFVIPESFNPRLRSKAASFIMALSWLLAFAKIEIWSLMIKSAKMMVMFLFFSGVSLLALILVFFVLKK